MNLRTWPVVAVALAGLLLLTVLSIVAARQKSQEIYSQLDDVNRRHRQVETLLQRLRSDLHLSGIFIRDYLLDTSRENAGEYREWLAEIRENHRSTLAELKSLGGPGEADRVSSMQRNLEDYWETFNPLFGWNAAQKIALSPGFLRREVLPRRDAVLQIAGEIEAFYKSNLDSQRAAVDEREREFRSYLDQMLWRSLLLGVLVAITAVIRIRVLERRSSEQQLKTQDAELEMRRLSHQLVETQEEERKKLSRELHDHIGQMLTALRMELGRAERSRVWDAAGRAAALGESKKLTETIVRTVRDLALGLRPSMLDDLGLKPALEWHARDFSRRYGVPIDLTVEGDLASLPETHRTCVYRVIQEALTNCARHSGARRIAVTVQGSERLVDVSVNDDGVGIDETGKTRGLGLLGIGERARELNGTFSIESLRGTGTRLHITIPLTHPEHEAMNLANTAG